MKRIFTLLFIVALTFSFTNLFANTVYVSGYVKNNGVGVANKAVTIWVDSLNGAGTCYQIHTKYTNANGFYADTLSCNSNISIVKSSTPNCNGLILNNTAQVNANGIVESNFALNCTTPPTGTCVANYSFSINGNTVQFINTSTTSSTLATSFWSFGNGSSATTQNPTATYSANGTYMVGLFITSTTGCKDSIYKAITITANTTTPVCNAAFQFAPDSTTNPKLVRFYAGANTAYPSNDPVIERKWKFGDGDSLTGNVQNPTHLYANPGTYNVCLKVKTQSGCVSDLCKTISITAPTNTTNTCIAQFISSRVAPKKVSFNSTMSYAPQADSIIERKWLFGDGASLSGNNANPFHEYINLGIYTVCLKIKTASGCQSEICKPVLLQDSVPTAGNQGAINIVSLYPNPVTTQLRTVVWSATNNVTAELAIYDIYGTKKWSINKNLLQGNNVTVISTAFLLSGPYLFKVNTTYGERTKSFYKL